MATSTKTKTKKVETPNIGGPIIAELERIYAQLRTEFSELPEHIVFTLGHGRVPQGGLKYGHFATGRWQYRPTSRHKAQDAYEGMIASECLAAGTAQVFQTVVHEAVHALAAAREIKETSRQGRWHNKMFLKLAEEMGMEWDGDFKEDKDGNVTDQPLPNGRIGFSMVRPTPTLLTRYKKAIERLDKVITAAGISYTPPPRTTREVAVVTMHESGDEFELGLKTYEKIEDNLLPHDMEVEER